MKKSLFISLLLGNFSVLLASNEHSNRKLSYGDDLIPLFEQNCIKCHGGPDLRRKGRIMKKGGLDLTKIDSVKETITPGDPKDSLLYTLTVTDDEDEIMPPKGRHLSTSEAQLIYKWIEQGADFTNFVYVPKEKSRYTILVDKAKPAPEELLSKLGKTGAIITRVSDQGSLLRVNFPKEQNFDSRLSNLLKLLGPYISDLDLSFYPHADLSFLAEFKNLTHLNLRHSKIRNQSLSQLKYLVNLEHINCYDSGLYNIEVLNEFPALKYVNLTATKVKSPQVDKLKTDKPKLNIGFLDLNSLNMTIPKTTLSAIPEAIEWKSIQTVDFGSDSKIDITTEKYASWTCPESIAPASKIPPNSNSRTMIYSADSIILEYKKLDPKRFYKIKLTFLSSPQPRKQSLLINNKSVKDFDIALNVITTEELIIRPEQIINQQVQLTISKIEGANAIVSTSELYEGIMAKK